MRQLTVFGVVVTGILAAYFTDLGQVLVFFVLTGYVPLINVSIPPVAMLVFWVVLVPAVIIAYRISSYSFWEILEIIGKMHQRHLDRSVRWVNDQVVRPEQFIPLATIVMLHAISKLPDSSTSIPTLSLRRRFIPVSAV